MGNQARRTERAAPSAISPIVRRQTRPAAAADLLFSRRHTGHCPAPSSAVQTGAATHTPNHSESQVPRTKTPAIEHTMHATRRRHCPASQRYQPSDVRPATSDQLRQRGDISAATSARRRQHGDVSPATSAQRRQPNDVSPATSAQRRQPGDGQSLGESVERVSSLSSKQRAQRVHRRLPHSSDPEYASAGRRNSPQQRESQSTPHKRNNSPAAAASS